MEGLSDRLLETAFKAAAKNPLKAGQQLGDILKGTEANAVQLIVPRSVGKSSNPERVKKWRKFLADPETQSELRVIGVSIANTLRPVAGNKFAAGVQMALNLAFQQQELPLIALTKGTVKRDLSKRFKEVARPVVEEGSQSETEGAQVDETTGIEPVKDLKPDIDIVVALKQGNQMPLLTIQGKSRRKPEEILKPIAIISVKTTLAERVMQTISWNRAAKLGPEDVRSIPIFLVTAWENFEQGKANRERVQELDGVYYCNSQAKSYGKIKPFTEIVNDLKKLIPKT